jgi:cobalt-zinc-cadmium efflux system outer membrane protein
MLAPIRNVPALLCALVTSCCVGMTLHSHSLLALQGTPSAPQSYAMLYQLALTNNLDIQAVQARYAIRRAAIRIAAQRPNPVLTSEFLRDEPHQSVFFELPLELGGRRVRRIEVAESELKLTDAELADAFRKMRHDLRRAFYGVVLADQRIALAQAEVDIAQRVLSVAGERYRAGAVPLLETLQAKLRLTRAQGALALEEKQRLAAQSDLNTVLNLKADFPSNVSGSLLDFPSGFEISSYQQAALQQNPDLQAFAQELEVENRRLRLFRAERLPDVVLQAGSDFSSSEFSVGPRAGFTLEIPIFKKRQGQSEESLAIQDQIRLAAQATRRHIEGAIGSAYTRMQAQRSRVESFQKEIVPAAEEQERMAEESYREGKSPILTVLDAQRSLRDVRAEFLQAQFDFQMAVADLEEAAGISLP